MTEPTLTPEEETFLNLTGARHELMQRLTAEGLNIEQIAAHPEWVALNEKIRAVPADVRKRFTPLFDPKMHENIRHLTGRVNIHMDHRTGMVSLVGDGEPATGYLMNLEARTATRSMDENAEPLTDEEYLARKRQLADAALEDAGVRFVREASPDETDDLGKTLAHLLNNTPAHVAAAKRREYFLGHQKAGSKLPPPILMLPDAHVGYMEQHAQDVSRILASERALKVHTPLIIDMGGDLLFKRGQPVRIMGESEVRLLASMVNQKQTREVKRLRNTSERRLKKKDWITALREQRGSMKMEKVDIKPHQRTVIDAILGRSAASTRGLYIHSHKGHKPKRGNPYRR